MADLGASIRGEAQATLEGLLRKRLYVLMLRPVRPLDEELSEQTAALLPDHFAWLFEREREGRIFAAGPFLGDDERSYTGDGMFIVRADSIEDARELGRGDPIVAAGLRTVEARAWELNEGSIGLSVSYSSGTVTIE